MENARASRNTEDTAEEEQGANFGQAQSRDGEDVKGDVQLKHGSADAPLSMADGRGDFGRHWSRFRCYSWISGCWIPQDFLLHS